MDKSCRLPLWAIECVFPAVGGRALGIRSVIFMFPFPVGGPVENVSFPKHL